MMKETDEQQDLYDLLETVDSKETFLRFLYALLEDRLDSLEKECVSPSPPCGPDANGWENTTVEGFLEAMHAWVDDSRIEEQPSWRLFAEILFAGKYYE